jgi:hypothetical protein
MGQAQRRDDDALAVARQQVDARGEDPQDVFAVEGCDSSSQ